MKTTKITNTILILCLLLLCGPVLAQSNDSNIEEYEFSQAELDQILAPIALYPDTILSHILIASTYPLEVVQAARWTVANDELEGDAALAAVEPKDWAPSVKALVPFPQILEKMSEDLDWMQKLGDAFLQDEEVVLASIQDLRHRAYDEGNLDDLDHLEVTEDDNQIVIESRVQEVVYVPYYDSRVVYGNWWWTDYPPIYWAHHHNYHHGHSFYWGPRVYVGTGFYFSSFHWHNRHVVVVDRHNHRFHSGRHVARYSGATRWTHNPRHRRGVSYRAPRIIHNRVSATSGRRDAYTTGRSNLNVRNNNQNIRSNHRELNAQNVQQRLSQPSRVQRDVRTQGQTTSTRATPNQSRLDRTSANPRTNTTRTRVDASASNQSQRTRVERPTQVQRQNTVKLRTHEEYSPPVSNERARTTTRSTAPERSSNSRVSNNSSSRSTSTRSSSRNMNNSRTSASRNSSTSKHRR